MTVKVDWLGAIVRQQIVQRLQSGVTRFNEQLVADARQELYPGHGEVTGTLKNAIEAVPARLDGSRIIGTVGAYGVRYSLLVHQRYYRFILDPLMRRMGSAVGMITQA